MMLAALSPGGSEQQERPAALPGLVRDPHGLQDPGEGPGPAAQQVGEARGLPAGGPERLLGAPRGQRDGAEAPKASKAAWLGPPGREASASVSAAQQETALQRLLELHREVRRRRRQDREQQRLRVRYSIPRNTQNFQQLLWPPGAEEPAPGE
ncbi:hypothetical protein HPG69_000519 [Diceros bicornis minor]|uniref:Uncharacterized protein n=1 Tax=Diceros bicornis minor TaxID=77932 RepID=A0A7J7FHR1_DICBM|nr:hypothetical protein HPG69_000519 [Diceros bicornis minor]